MRRYYCQARDGASPRRRDHRALHRAPAPVPLSAPSARGSARACGSRAERSSVTGRDVFARGAGATCIECSPTRSATACRFTRNAAPDARPRADLIAAARTRPGGERRVPRVLRGRTASTTRCSRCTSSASSTPCSRSSPTSMAGQPRSVPHLHRRRALAARRPRARAAARGELRRRRAAAHRGDARARSRSSSSWACCSTTSARGTATTTPDAARA